MTEDEKERFGAGVRALVKTDGAATVACRDGRLVLIAVETLRRMLADAEASPNGFASLFMRDPKHITEEMLSKPPQGSS